MGRDRSLCRELPQRVAMNAEVLGGAASIKPLARVFAALRLVPLDQAIDDQVGEAAQDLIDQSAVESLAVAAAGADVRSRMRSWSPTGSRSEVAYACIVGTSLQVSARPRGAPTPPGLLYSLHAEGIAWVGRKESIRTVLPLTQVRFSRMGRKVDVDDLIDTHTVAEILGLAHRNTVSEYQSRYDDMPRPVVDLGGGRSKLWLRPEVRAVGGASSGHVLLVVGVLVS